MLFQSIFGSYFHAPWSLKPPVTSSPRMPRHRISTSWFIAPSHCEARPLVAMTTFGKPSAKEASHPTAAVLRPKASQLSPRGLSSDCHASARCQRSAKPWDAALQAMRSNLSFESWKSSFRPHLWLLFL